MAFFGITVNFIIQKLKSKHLVCLCFYDEDYFSESSGFRISFAKNKKMPVFILKKMKCKRKMLDQVQKCTQGASPLEKSCH